MAKNGLMFIIIVSFLLSFSQVMAFFPNPYPYFPPQNQPTKILMIGDSHIAPGSGDNQVVGHFGEKLHTLLSDTGAKVKTYGSGGSSPYSWARGDIWIAKTLIIDETNKISKNNKNKVLSEIKEEVKPNIILITLGTNIIPLVDSNDEAGFKLRINTAKELAAQATKDGTKCIWVGPPNRKNSPDESLKKTVEAIKSAIEPTCTFIDSTVLSNNAHMVDSFHYNKQGGQEWAQKVFEIIKPKINFGTSTKQPTTTSFQKILILGDSHYAGTYGQTLDTLLKQSGHTIESFGCVSATAQHYINGSFHCVQPKLGSRHNSNPEDYTLKPITESLSSFSPNLVIISLGGNIEAATSSKEERVKQITALVKSITDKNIKCIWVGPPSKEDLNKNAERNTFYEHLKEGLGSTCQLIDSRSYAQLKESDNGHFPSGDQRAKAWAQKVFQ